MNSETFASWSILTIYIFIALIMLLSCEAGVQLGKRFTNSQDKDASSALGPMVGGLLGMLAFVLAFTFSMAASHHSLRRQNVVDESNAINSAYLRSDLLDKQSSNEVKRLLSQYVDLRLKAAAGGDLNKALVDSKTLQQLLWVQVSTAAKKAPSLNTTLMIQSVNRVIEMHEQRLMAGLRNRIPVSVWIAMVIICILTMTTMGIQIGLTGKRRLIAVVPLSFAFAALVSLVVDLNRPQAGLIRVEQQAMINLQDNMQR